MRRVFGLALAAACSAILAFAAPRRAAPLGEAQTRPLQGGVEQSREGPPPDEFSRPCETHPAPARTVS